MKNTDLKVGSTKLLRICLNPECNNKFETKGKQRSCCRECAKRVEYLRAVGLMKEEKKNLIGICENPECDNKFEEKGEKRFCSRYCKERSHFLKNKEKINKQRRKNYRKKHRIKTDLICLNCGIEFTPKLYATMKFCSIECRQKYHQKSHLRKANKYVFKVWKEALGCQFCGYNKLGAAIELHHVLGKDFEVNIHNLLNMKPRTKDELKKCILVCANCHREIHNGLIDEKLILERHKEFQEKIKKITDIEYHNWHN